MPRRPSCLVAIALNRLVRRLCADPQCSQCTGSRLDAVLTGSPLRGLRIDTNRHTTQRPVRTLPVTGRCCNGIGSASCHSTDGVGEREHEQAAETCARRATRPHLIVCCTDACCRRNTVDRDRKCRKAYAPTDAEPYRTAPRARTCAAVLADSTQSPDGTVEYPLPSRECGGLSCARPC